MRNKNDQHTEGRGTQLHQVWRQPLCTMPLTTPIPFCTENVTCCGATLNDSNSVHLMLNAIPAPLSPRKQGKRPQLSMHQPAVAVLARTTPPRLNDNPGSNKHRPRRPPTDAETTPNPSRFPCDKHWMLLLTRCAVCAPPLATHHPPPVSGNQGSRLAPCPSPPPTAAHL